DRHCQRLQQCPGNADCGLLVPNLDVSPGQKINEFAVRPEFVKVESSPTGTGLNFKDRQLSGLHSRAPFEHHNESIFATRLKSESLPDQGRAVGQFGKTDRGRSPSAVW